MTQQETEHHQNKQVRQTEQVCPVASLYENASKTHCWFFSSSPYSQPSFSSWMSRVIMSPSSKLRSVGLLPAVWGKMVLTRGFLPTLRPDDWDAERDRLPSPRLPWSEDNEEPQKNPETLKIWWYQLSVQTPSVLKWKWIYVWTKPGQLHSAPPHIYHTVAVCTWVVIRRGGEWRSGLWVEHVG